MALRDVTLDDKYVVEHGHVFVTGIQALVRLPMLQRDRDLAAGLNTGGFISGYRGSPLGALDLQLFRAEKFLKEKHVQFLPGVNEDLAATAVWGTQQSPLTGECNYDGVFSMWYAKGPGVDRSGDALRHGNLAGASEHGGVLCLMGDDHACESSTTAHQTEFGMKDALIPVLNPAGVQDILDFGLLGWGMSRYTGCWVGLKCVHDTVEATASVSVDADRTRIITPDDFPMPEGGLNIRWPDTPQEQEQRLHEHRLEAVDHFWRANSRDEIIFDSPDAWLGLATCGKSYLDTRQALNLLGLDEQGAKRLGIRLYKIAMTWPLDLIGGRRFAKDLESVIVVEEKRALVETQLKEALYGTANAPSIIGKRDEQGAVLFQPWLRLNGVQIAIEIGKRILAKRFDEGVAAKLAELEAQVKRDSERGSADMIRTPYFCSGCPHNSSTVVPEGSKALAGIGCHFMAQWMDRDTDRYTQMGGEGASWIGEGKFSSRKHMFQNIGDGTYFHSGFLAIRAAIASGVNITYKILFNDAVAMTGGQPMDGDLSPQSISQQMYGEGAKKIVVVTDEPEKYSANSGFAPGVTIHHRKDLDGVQRELREIEGTTILIYDQTCASEKRRRRKRGEFADPDKWAFINSEVCEGCGDCGTKSNCVAVSPDETELGRKRRIDQSACNKDYSCVNGFCPSFVTVHGGKLKKGVGVDTQAKAGTDDAQQAVWNTAIPEPTLPAIDGTYSMLLTGVGGQGVVTVGAIIGMAAHIADLGISILDMIGLAQKGGAVTSHLIIAKEQEAITATHVAAGDASLVIGGDVVTTASDATLMGTRTGKTHAVVNTYQIMTGDFTNDRDKVFPLNSLQSRIREACGEDNVDFVNASTIATKLLGNSIGANFFLTGFAWQRGLIPIPKDAIQRAIELNGQAVQMNLEAFEWGRRAAHDQKAVEKIARPSVVVTMSGGSQKESIDDIVANRVERLVAYQDRAYADRYQKFVSTVRETESSKTRGQSTLAESVARNYYKLLAYKDEYEVARLYTDPAFRERLDEQFEGNYRVKFHLAPPLFASKDPVTGHLHKKEYGSWMMSAFKLLARMKGLRGGALDVFGYSTERKRERALVAQYESDITALLSKLSDGNHSAAVELANLPDEIRGYGHVKEQSMDEAEVKRSQLLAVLDAPSTPSKAA